jgi:hypothetical protein
MQLRPYILDYLWADYGEALATDDLARAETIWALIDGFERLSEQQTQSFLRELGLPI